MGKMYLCTYLCYWRQVVVGVVGHDQAAEEDGHDAGQMDALTKTRVADPVHFRPDPAPANQNFKNRIRIPDPTGT